MKTRDVRSLVSLAAGLGLLVAIFAAAEFYDASLRSICSVNAVVSCARVDTSGLTSTLGVPDYAWGIVGFVAILALAAFAEQRPRDVRRADALLALTTAGMALALYFLYVEVGRIHAICLVCVTAYLFGAVAWVGAISLDARTRARAREPPPGAPAPAPS